MTKYEEYIQTEGGKKLLSKYKSDEYGIWEIYLREDNGSYGSLKYRQHFRYVQGTFDAALRFAIATPDWDMWNQGKIDKINPILQLH